MSPQFGDNAERKLKRFKSEIWLVWTIGTPCAAITLLLGALLSIKTIPSDAAGWMVTIGYGTLLAGAVSATMLGIAYFRISSLARELPLELDRRKRKEDTLTRLKPS